MPAGGTGGERSSTRRAAVHVVTEEEACSGAYSIQDVVLPLPGGQIQYPEYKEDYDTSHQVLHFQVSQGVVSESAGTLPILQ